MRKILTLLILIQSLCISAQTTIYVNQNVQGGLQNGLSWTDAFTDLQQALSTANDGDEIWVAEGTYYPTNTLDRTISLVLMQGVRMYGGFAGTETALAERDFEVNPTILSGNIGNPQGADNSYHVLYGTALDSTTIVDGFTITKGVANGNSPLSSTEWGGGLLLEPSSDIYNTCPIIQNCRFEENYALIGGAIHCYWEIGNYYVNPIIRNCQFISNRAQQSGGGIYKSGPAIIEKPFVIEHCSFLKNSAFYDSGGGLFFTLTENTSIIRNCAFEKDTSRFSWGGAVFYNYFEEGKLIVEACEFNDNYAGIGTAIYTNYYLNSDNPFWIEILNCDFGGNKSNGQGGAILLSGESESKIFAKFFDCNFLNNRSGSYGTALLVSGKQITIDLDHCIFSNNVGMPPNPNGSRYAVYMGGLTTDSKFSNCLFANNESALGFFSPENAKATHRITNCTFYQNGKYVIDKTRVPLGVDGSIECYITNSIFEDDATFDKMFSDNNITGTSLDGYHIDYSFLSLDDNMTPNDAAFGSNTVFNATPYFVDTTNNNFRLQKCSPAVNAGNNIIVDTLGILTDLDGNPRIRFDTVDIGAYEAQDPCFTSSSTTPQAGAYRPVLSPNPASPGSPLDIQIFELTHPKIEWIMRDTYGRTLSSGSVLLSEKQHFSTVAPTSPGFYFIEMRSGNQSVWLKFVVDRN
ncbi:MAG: choice-of-anchor Q domain-containing protein [Saprospiraceae bacterium]|nr:choice-of-anchor Q domain-containing protein [Saprospiraceae bacterium]